jgi:hypothetical protein
MNKRHITRILGLSAEFRAAIEVTSRPNLPITFENFPRGSCGDAILLLAKFLEENECGSFHYVLGEREERSHAWLEQCDLIVDITGDQFADMPHPVFVKRRSRWHASFNGKRQYVADFDIFDEYTRVRLRAAYNVVLHNLNALRAHLGPRLGCSLPF